jgi:hypothetical protein
MTVPETESQECVMGAVILEPELRSKLNGLNEELEFRDEAGHLLGHFLPPEVYRKLLTVWAESTCPNSPEELERLRRRPGARTWAEIKRRLGTE